MRERRVVKDTSTNSNGGRAETTHESLRGNLQRAGRASLPATFTNNGVGSGVRTLPGVTAGWLPLVAPLTPFRIGDLPARPFRATPDRPKCSQLCNAIRFSQVATNYFGATPIDPSYEKGSRDAVHGYPARLRLFIATIGASSRMRVSPVVATKGGV